MLLYVTVFAFHLRRNSCISAWSPTSYTVYLKSAREMGAMPERALKFGFAGLSVAVAVGMGLKALG
jgi:hypothetical protein